MPNMNTRADLELLKTLLHEKQTVFKCWTTIQLYVQTNFHGYLKMTLIKKSGNFSSFCSGFRKILMQSDEELSRQAENDRVEQFRHDT